MGRDGRWLAWGRGGQETWGAVDVRCVLPASPLPRHCLHLVVRQLHLGDVCF